MCSARRSERLRLRASVLVTVGLAQSWTPATTAAAYCACECESYRTVDPSSLATVVTNWAPSACPPRTRRLAGRERRRRRGAAAARSLNMEEAGLGIGPGLGTTLPTQQWSGFERFQEVQQILDRNKCACAAWRGLKSWR